MADLHLRHRYSNDAGISCFSYLREFPRLVEVVAIFGVLDGAVLIVAQVGSSVVPWSLWKGLSVREAWDIQDLRQDLLSLAGEDVFGWLL